jgi:hypothetical protein
MYKSQNLSVIILVINFMINLNNKHPKSYKNLRISLQKLIISKIIGSSNKINLIQIIKIKKSISNN